MDGWMWGEREEAEIAGSVRMLLRQGSPSMDRTRTSSVQKLALAPECGKYAITVSQFLPHSAVTTGPNVDRGVPNSQWSY